MDIADPARTEHELSFHAPRAGPGRTSHTRGVRALPAAAVPGVPSRPARPPLRLHR